MAFSTTVLAWGMVDFQTGYVNAYQWDNALDMLKWTTDYFLKAHTAPNELYFQVGEISQNSSLCGDVTNIQFYRLETEMLIMRTGDTQNP